VVEAFLAGEEVSLLLVCDGHTAVPLPQVEDHKAALDGDRGPMTGGMGTVAPVDLLGTEGLREVMARIVEPTLSGLRDEGRPFAGTLFLGLMRTEAGPRLLEYNVRFGDPETQALVPLLASDAYDLLAGAAGGTSGRVRRRGAPARARASSSPRPGTPARRASACRSTCRPTRATASPCSTRARRATARAGWCRRGAASSA
jgi:phosphoribosylamine---glycine ligase